MTGLRPIVRVFNTPAIVYTKLWFITFVRQLSWKAAKSNRTQLEIPGLDIQEACGTVPTSVVTRCSFVRACVRFCGAVAAWDTLITTLFISSATIARSSSPSRWQLCWYGLSK
ncbi:hypothetical protein IQ07DRAFT_317047 [Pyrenochaeta sp. DS3sAY3a]|nr:hypothetical protein IQ07DRAFT_317047 [Pyrenochaeta sp. DS3sAY3a]